MDVHADTAATSAAAADHHNIHTILAHTIVTPSTPTTDVRLIP